MYIKKRLKIPPKIPLCILSPFPPVGRNKERFNVKVPDPGWEFLLEEGSEAVEECAGVAVGGEGGGAEVVPVDYLGWV